MRGVSDVGKMLLCCWSRYDLGLAFINQQRGSLGEDKGGQRLCCGPGRRATDDTGCPVGGPSQAQSGRKWDADVSVGVLEAAKEAAGLAARL
jgi:hypothetical protein